MATPTPEPDPAETPPYVFVVTPLVIFVLVGILATIVQTRRRNRLRAMGLWPPPEPYFGTLGHATPSTTTTTTTRRMGPDGTWIQTAVRGGRGGGGGGGGGRGGARRARPRRGARNAEGSLAARSVEGLNELGEAPPPYDPKAKGNGLKAMELEELERGVGADPPGYGTVAAHGTGESRLGSNNPYAAMVARDEAGEASEVRAPPPAVTR